MADGVRVYDGGGSQIDTQELTVEASPRHRQRIQVSGGSSEFEISRVENVDPATTDYGLVTRPVGLLGFAANFATYRTNLEARDIATGANQTTANSSLASLVAKDFATQTTLASLTSNFSTYRTNLEARDIATGANQATGNTSLASLVAKDFATQTTLASLTGNFATYRTNIEARDLATGANQATANTSLSSLVAKDFATQTTLASLTTNFATYRTNLEARDLATNTTLASLTNNFATYRTNIEARDLATGANQTASNSTLTTIAGKDFATQTTLVALNNNVTTLNTNVTTDRRVLTERMSAKAPASGYTLWVDTADPSYIYVLEAPAGTAVTATGFRGIRFTLNANGNPVGVVQTNVGSTLTWNTRSTDANWLS